jgi:hypothetical protein
MTGIRALLFILILALVHIARPPSYMSTGFGEPEYAARRAAADGRRNLMV